MSSATRVEDKPGRQGSLRRTYHYDGERGGYSLTRSERGWIVESWSRVTGDTTGRRVLVPYGTPAPVGEFVRQGVDPEVAINEFTTYGQWLAEYARRGDGVRVLARGREVR